MIADTDLRPYGSQTNAKAELQISVMDLFTIGIGPSSSHTLGPMRAAFRFIEWLVSRNNGSITRVRCELFGSLALTGAGHAADTAIIAGLAGWVPEHIDPAELPRLIAAVAASGILRLGNGDRITFERGTNILFRKGEFLPFHPNGMRFAASLSGGMEITREYYSVGGGALVEGNGEVCSQAANVSQTFPFSSGAELLAVGDAFNLSIAEIVRANESAWREAEQTDRFLDAVRTAMMACIDKGCEQEGTLPGGLKVRRRARQLREDLIQRDVRTDPAVIFQWVSLWALAVNEENAAGGRVVTAPTNGAAGVIPAVLKFYETYTADPSPAGSRNFLLTAAAIGFLYKKRASISAAEMGCQGEVGVACSMAAAALASALGGTNRQIENAAEIGMEHNLGLTCDPIGGLVQIPCIERNTMGAIKAINAAYLALRGDGAHIVSLDSVIETMRQTGEDMRTKYKETSLGGLAVNVVEC
jgi:L-serine dehydratase